METQLEHFVFNLSKTFRIRQLEGRDYAVVPMAMLGEAVLNGSGGPLFYPWSEIDKMPASWNGRVILKNHSVLNGQAVEAGIPAVIENQRVGNVFYAKTHKDKLRAEAWIDIGKADLVDPRIMDRIRANQKVEISTGLFIDVDPTPGTFNGIQYNAIARNFRPDHLAILLDDVGAYSLKDGGGLLQTNRRVPMSKEEMVSAILTNSSKWTEGQKDLLFSMDEAALGVLVQHAEDEKKEADKKKEAEEAAKKAAEEQKSKEAEEAAAKKAAEEEAAKKAAEEELAKTKSLDAVANFFKTAAPDAIAEYFKGLSAEAYLALAPPQIADTIRNGLEAHSRETGELVQKIVAYELNSFSAEQLQAKSVEELRAIAAMIPSTNGPTDGTPNQNRFVGLGISTPPVTLNRNGSKPTGSGPLGLPEHTVPERK